MDSMAADGENRTFSDKFMLRLPDGMRDRIKGAAELNGRSMNAEIVATLDEKYPEWSQTDIDVRIFLRRLALQPEEERLAIRKKMWDLLYPPES